jgi:hypothetical protein
MAGATRAVRGGEVMTFLRLEPTHSGDVVGMLRRSLVDAEAGDVRSVVVATIRPDGTFTVGWQGPNTFFEKLGMLEQIKHEMMADAERA